MNENDPALARRYGAFLQLATLAATIAFAIGLARKSYWAVAAPVAVGTFASLAAAGLLGRLLASTPDEPPSP